MIRSGKEKLAREWVEESYKAIFLIRNICYGIVFFIAVAFVIWLFLPMPANGQPLQNAVRSLQEAAGVRSAETQLVTEAVAFTLRSRRATGTPVPCTSEQWYGPSATCLGAITNDHTGESLFPVPVGAILEITSVSPGWSGAEEYFILDYKRVGAIWNLESKRIYFNKNGWPHFTAPIRFLSGQGFEHYCFSDSTSSSCSFHFEGTITRPQ